MIPAPFCCIYNFLHMRMRSIRPDIAVRPVLSHQKRKSTAAPAVSGSAHATVSPVTPCAALAAGNA